MAADKEHRKDAVSSRKTKPGNLSADSPILMRLLALRDLKYAEFNAKLIPNVDSSHFLGVRTPQLRALAKSLLKEDPAAVQAFLSDLPHRYFEEDQLHAFVISLTKDFDTCLSQVKAFLPYVNNWATCDQLGPKVFAKHNMELLPQIRKWLKSKKTYEVRFGIRMLMCHFLDKDFDPVYPEMVASVRSEEYYINMMIAWYFATALAKQYDATIPWIEEHKLPAWVHNKTIQKAIESYRVSDEQKAYLRTLKST